MNKAVQSPDNVKRQPAPKSKKRKPTAKLKSGKNIVPSESIASTALVFVIAIMAFLACLTLGAVAMINTSASQWQSDISREVTIQIKPADGREMDKSIRDASRIALSFPGVSRVTALNDAATARLLEPWLGSGLELSEKDYSNLVLVVGLTLVSLTAAVEQLAPVDVSDSVAHSESCTDKSLGRAVSALLGG